jgi:hypothetical protein
MRIQNVMVTIKTLQKEPIVNEICINKYKFSEKFINVFCIKYDMPLVQLESTKNFVSEIILQISKLLITAAVLCKA